LAEVEGEAEKREEEGEKGEGRRGRLAGGTRR
jgi:hypothetical protein